VNDHVGLGFVVVDDADFEGVSGVVAADEHRESFVVVSGLERVPVGVEHVVVGNAVLAGALGDDDLHIHTLPCYRPDGKVTCGLLAKRVIIDTPHVDGGRTFRAQECLTSCLRWVSEIDADSERASVSGELLGIEYYGCCLEHLTPLGGMDARWGVWSLARGKEGT